MTRIVRLARRLVKSRAVMALAALWLVALTALGTQAQILIDVTGGSQDWKTNGSVNLVELINLSNGLTAKALPVVIVVAPLVFVAGALMMQFGGPSGAKRASAVMYGSVGAAVAVVAAKGLLN